MLTLGAAGTALAPPEQEADGCDSGSSFCVTESGSQCTFRASHMPVSHLSLKPVR